MPKFLSLAMQKLKKKLEAKAQFFLPGGTLCGLIIFWIK